MQFVVCVLFNEKPSVNAIWLEKELKGFSMIYVYFQIFLVSPLRTVIQLSKSLVIANKTSHLLD